MFLMERGCDFGTVHVGYELGAKHASARYSWKPEEAFKQGAFYRQIQVLCPDGSVAALAASYEDLPPNVKCWRHRDGHCEFQMIRTDALCRREVFAVRSGYIP